MYYQYFSRNIIKNKRGPIYVVVWEKTVKDVFCVIETIITKLDCSAGQ